MRFFKKILITELKRLGFKVNDNISTRECMKILEENNLELVRTYGSSIDKIKCVDTVNDVVLFEYYDKGTPELRVYNEIYCH